MIPVRIVDFSAYPAGRDEKDGPFNGKKFRDEILVPAIRKAIETRDKVLVILDDVKSYGSSFLEEAFGGLVRVSHFKRSELESVLEIRAERPVYNTYKRQIENHIKKAPTSDR
ncbi:MULTISPECIES: STAS-like domain-containing protein [unclassified Ensifer]|uniref:STAS-like domain-containing protein n=1 Tax=unclassified Ensifer TaxID=2633371 RepID=UPI003010099D